MTSDRRPWRAWPNSWNRVRASSKERSAGWPFGGLEKFMTLTMIGRTSPSSFSWSRKPLIQAPLRFEDGRSSRRGRGRRRAVRRGRLARPGRPGCRARNVVAARSKARPKSRAGGVEGRLDHLVELEVGLELGLVEVEPALAGASRRSAASRRRRGRGCRPPRRSAPGGRAASRRAARPAALPHRLEQPGDSLGRLRHRVGERKWA